MTRIEVTRVRLAVDDATLALAQALVDDTERARAQRFSRVEDRARHLLGRALARRLLAHRTGLAPRALRLRDDANGKPVLEGASDARFNLSHSGDWIVCAIADGALPVGVDVQRLEPGMARPDDYGPVFGPLERAAIGSAGGPQARIAAFARAWARKEALVKAAGVGLVLELDEVDIVDGAAGPAWAPPRDPRTAQALSGRWTIRDVAIDDAHACAVAWGADDGRIETTELAAATLVAG